MRGLSISQAWDETRDILTRDGRLYVAVALALVVLPAVVTGVINPSGVASTKNPLWITLVSLIASLITLAGQLGLVRLALGPSVTVGGAIAHGIRRMPVYLGGALIVIAGLLVLAIPFAVVLAAMGLPLGAEASGAPPHPATLIAALLFFAVACFVGVRMMMTAPVASAEPVGPVALIKRSWHLTAGHFWRLLGFLVLFFVAGMIVIFAIEAVVGIVSRLMTGPTVEPMSVSALIVALVRAVLNAALITVLAVMLARIYVQLAGRPGTEASVPSTGA